MRINLNPFSFLFQLVLIFTIPSLNGTLNFELAVNLLLLFLSAFILGIFLMSYIKNNFDIRGNSILNLGTYIILIIIAPSLYLLQYLPQIILLSILFLLAIALTVQMQKHLEIEYNFLDLTPLVVSTLVTFFVFYNWKEALSISPVMYKGYFQDFYWFTAMTASIKDFDFSNSNFEQGTGIYHHVLGLFPAAVISSLTKLSSHTALWSVSMPLAIFSAFSAIKMLFEQVNENITIIKQILFLTFFVFLLPINPKAILLGHYNEMIWFGAGHTLPVLPTWAAVYVFSILIVIIIVKTNDINIKNILVLMTLMFCLTWSKVTSFFILTSLILLYFVLFEKKIFSNKTKLILISLIPSVILIIFYYSHSSAKFVFEPGQIVIDYLQTNHLTSLNYVKAICFGLATIFIWSNFKAIVFFFNDKKIKIGFIVFVLCFIFCLVIESVLRIKSFSINGKLMDDSSFDLLQFTRSAFIYFNIFFLISLIYFTNKTETIIKERLIHLGILSYVFVIIISLFQNQKFYITQNNIIQRNWDKNVELELRKYRETKKAMISDIEFSGQFLAAHDINNWYTSIENRNGGYTYSYDFINRYNRLKNFLVNGKSKIYLNELRIQKVTILVATPNTKFNYLQLVQKGILKKIPHTEWLFTY
jgi:hypothetical protein